MTARAARGRVKGRSAGFTLTEILIAMFILAMGIIGIMSLFPVGLEATTKAINNQVVYLASQSAFAQVNYMVNVSEVFDYRARQPFYRASSGTANSVTWEVGDYRTTYQPGLSTTTAPSGAVLDRVGYYLTITSGAGAGQCRKIIGMTGSPAYTVSVAAPDFSPSPDSTSTFVITRWALPRTPGSRRNALVSDVSGDTITAVSIESELKRSPVIAINPNWRIGEFSPDTGVLDGRFFVVFLSGWARGKVLPITGQTSENTLNVASSVFNPTETSVQTLRDRVKPGDAFAILGTKEVDAIFPFATSGTQSGFGRGADPPPTDQTLPFGASRIDYRDYTPASLANAQHASPYSYVVILSNPEDVNAVSSGLPSYSTIPIPIPRDAFDPNIAYRERSVPRGARVDVLVFLNYDNYLPIENQSPATLVGTSSTTIEPFF